MTTKHTPGPWVVQSQPTRNTISIESKFQDGHFAVAVTPSFQECDIPNARLIAASPDMLNALTVIIDRLEAWTEYSERIARTEADSPRTEQHKNIAANYRELIRIARDSMPKS